MTKNVGYIVLVICIAGLAFLIDILLSSVGIELGKREFLNENGEVSTSLEIIYPLWHQVGNLVKNFLYGLSAAVFITVFVANKLEKLQREEKEEELRELNKAVNINVFDSLFKTIIPEEIFKIIKQDIIENKVIRRDAKWIFDFVELNGDIVCTQTTRYELHNLSQELVSDPIKLELDSLGGEKYEIKSAVCLDQYDSELVRYNPEDTENNKNVDVSEDGKKVSVSYTVNIPPESHVQYKTIFQRTYKGSVTDAQATKVPVIGMDIIVNFPDGYNFDISPLMSSPPKLITESRTQKIYKVNGGILPRQGFLYYLVKNNS